MSMTLRALIPVSVCENIHHAAHGLVPQTVVARGTVTSESVSFSWEISKYLLTKRESYDKLNKSSGNGHENE